MLHIKDVPCVLEIQEISESSLALSIELAANMPCLDGHFPGNPIVPGVAQVHWADQYAREYLKADYPELEKFQGLEVLKFQNLMQPEQVVDLHLEYRNEKRRLYFTYAKGEKRFSSGRIAYGDEVVDEA